MWGKKGTVRTQVLYLDLHLASAIQLSGCSVLHAVCETLRWPCQGHMAFQGGTMFWDFHCVYPSHHLGLAYRMALNSGFFSLGTPFCCPQ